MGVEGRDGGVVPVGDLPEEDPRDYWAGELQPGQADEVVGDRFGAEVDGDLDGGAAVGGCLLGGGHGHVGGAEVCLFRGEGGDARAAADGGVADRHARVLLLVSGEGQGEERRVERRARAGDPHRGGGSTGGGGHGLRAAGGSGCAGGERDRQQREGACGGDEHIRLGSAGPRVREQVWHRRRPLLEGVI